MLSSRGRLDTVALGDERIRIGPWRGDTRVAFVAPVPGPPLTATTVESCVSILRARGYHRILTAALGFAEQSGFVEFGFGVRERLHLLQHQLGDLPPTDRLPVRRGRTADRERVLAVDEVAFDAFWHLDRSGLTEARSATPTSRFRVATGGAHIVGYAITGRAGRTGYLQRLAVHPESQRHGIGRALVVDALGWVRRRGGTSVLVNTQVSNTGALRLYGSLGFIQQPEGLAVLEWPDVVGA